MFLNELAPSNESENIYLQFPYVNVHIISILKKITNNCPPAFYIFIIYTANSRTSR